MKLLTREYLFTHLLSNDEGSPGSNDVFGGIGMAYGSYSAGDRIGCCQDTSGINRNMRFEMYIR